MLDQLVIYSLTVYLLFHMAARSDLFRAPRGWLIKMLPSKLSYPLSCALCWTWWVGVLVTLLIPLWTGTLLLSGVILFAAPVFNMVLDLVVRALVKANEPPAISIPSVWTDATSTSQQGGQFTITSTTWPNWTLPPWTDPLPEGWDLVDGCPACPRLKGRRITFSWGPKEGIIEEGYRDEDDCSSTWGELKVRITGIDGKIYTDAWKRCHLRGNGPDAAPVGTAL